MPKHLKRQTGDADLRMNPMIGGSKGATMAGISADDLQDIQVRNTIEGDRDNDTNAYGGIAKPAGQGSRRRK